MNNPFPQPISEQIWDQKYRLITPNKRVPDDFTVQDTWRRIANACADVVPETYGKSVDLPTDFHLNRSREFYNALSDFKFLPAGRITAGAGSGRNVTLFNCYVMGTIPDSMSGIFEMLKEAALTMQQGGGIGYDFTPLRPKDSPVKGVDADASGPLTFMDVWDAMCKTVMSAGARRGAMMATMRCDHPDILDFVTAKEDPLRLRNFNVSVMATDEFMEAVRTDSDWPLVHHVAPTDTSLGQLDPDGDSPYIYKIIKAKELWDLVMESTYNHAEPGVLFIDRINQMNNLWYIEEISSTNPCGEQPLPPYGACLLGSVNLTKFVDYPFTEDADIDLGKLKAVVRSAVAMLDAVIDVSLFPIPQQREEAKMKRRMGIGVTGLADMLFMMDIKYGSDEAQELAELVMKTITLAAYRESIELARIFGPCPATDDEISRDYFCKSGFMVYMPEDIHEGIKAHGIRNALLTSIAPTGTISLYAGNISSGVEPIFASSYSRKVLNKDGTKREELVEDYAVKLYREYLEECWMDKDTEPKNLVTAQTLTPMDHIVMQAAVQKWVDSSISKTINCPEDISFEDFKAVYLEAYKRGCKGCTTYRPNAVTGSILSIEPEKKEQPEEAPRKSVDEMVIPIPRQQVLNGQTYKIKWQDSNVYVTINNHTDDEGKVIPFEIFINSKEIAHFQWTVALTRMISGVFRRGGDISFVVEELKNVFDPNGGAWVNGKYVPSFIALLGQTVEQHLENIYLYDTLPSSEQLIENMDKLLGEYPKEKPMQCSSCKGFNVQISGGCPVCGDCGHSKCG